MKEDLKKYKELVLATLDYYLDQKPQQIEIVEHYKRLKIQTEEHYQSNRLTKLKKWFHDLTEMLVETRDLGFSKYLKDKTGYEIDIFESYFHRVTKIIEKGKITTDDQFYDITIMVDELCQTEPVDYKRVDVLNALLEDYEASKSRKD